MFNEEVRIAEDKRHLAVIQAIEKGELVKVSIDKGVISKIKKEGDIKIEDNNEDKAQLPKALIPYYLIDP